MGPAQMRVLIERAFSDTVELVQSELKTMPLDRWSEGVFRYFFCRCFSNANPSIIQHVECDRIDLVLRGEFESAYIEFKFYQRPPKFNSKTGAPCGYKGGPGRKNMWEFQQCVEQLGNRCFEPNLSRYVVLFYADPPAASLQKNSFAESYGAYNHANREITVQCVAHKSLETDTHTLACKLFEVSRAVGAEAQI